MGLPKGRTNNPGGRPKGTPNVLTKEIREVYQELIESNLSNVDVWLQEVAKDNPDRALNFIIRLSEYVVPKLQSTNLTSSFNFENMTDEELNNLIARVAKLD